jgi:hypothetical protein
MALPRKVVEERAMAALSTTPIKESRSPRVESLAVAAR